MGDEIVIKTVEVIQGGLLQIDLRNETNGEWYRVFAEPRTFFAMIGEAMGKNCDDYMKQLEERWVDGT